MNRSDISSRVLVLVSAGETDRPPYTLEVAARLTAVHPDLLRYYCRIGLLGEKQRSADPTQVFDDHALYAVRRIEHFRRHHGVGWHALPLVCELIRESEGLRTELRFLRHR